MKKLCTELCKTKFITVGDHLFNLLWMYVCFQKVCTLLKQNDETNCHFMNTEVSFLCSWRQCIYPLFKKTRVYFNKRPLYTAPLKTVQEMWE